MEELRCLSSPTRIETRGKWKSVTVNRRISGGLYLEEVRVEKKKGVFLFSQDKRKPDATN